MRGEATTIIPKILYEPSEHGRLKCADAEVEEKSFGPSMTKHGRGRENHSLNEDGR